MNQSGTADSVYCSSLAEVYSVEGVFYFTPLADGQRSFFVFRRGIVKAKYIKDTSWDSG